MYLNLRIIIASAKKDTHRTVIKGFIESVFELEMLNFFFIEYQLFPINKEE